MKHGVSRCSECLKKNTRCDGQYSEEEYQSIERKKSELQGKVREAQARMAQRAQWYAGEMARLAQQQSLEMLQEQSRLSQVERQLDGLSRNQSDMVVRACLVMDALDEEDGFEADVPEPSSSDAQPNGGLFAYDDEQLAELLAGVSSQDFVGGTRQQTPQVCALPVPRCFLIHHSLTT
jgi:hypothetical protein